MKIGFLLEKHHQFCNDNLVVKNNLGDGFLFQNNKIYKAIRKAAVKVGAQFSTETNNFYQALPLTQLENVLSSKTIPYTDNVSVLADLNKQASDIQWNELAGGLKKNYLFHESCHLVARNVSNQYLKNNDIKIVQLLLEESFANSCELLAIADVADQAHKVFYAQNSYTEVFEQKVHISNAINEFGLKATFKVMIMAYLFSNFLKNSISENELNKILKLAGLEAIDAKQKKSLAMFAKQAFNLDYDFRTTTTALYLKLNKQNQNLQSINFLDLVVADKKYSQWLDAVISEALVND